MKYFKLTACKITYCENLPNLSHTNSWRGETCWIVKKWGNLTVSRLLLASIQSSTDCREQRGICGEKDRTKQFSLLFTCICEMLSLFCFVDSEALVFCGAATCSEYLEIVFCQISAGPDHGSSAIFCVTVIPACAFGEVIHRMTGRLCCKFQDPWEEVHQLPLFLLSSDP